MRRILAVASATTLTLGLIVGVASTASSAAIPSTLTLGYSGGSFAVSATEISANPGDTFTFFNTVNGVAIELRNGTGSISVGGTSCTGSDCTVGAVTGSALVTVVSSGTFTLNGNPGTYVQTVTILGSSSGSSSNDPALVYPTATINGNGGTCTGPSQYIKEPGQGDWGAAAGMYLIDCTRANYTFMGWALSATATTSTFSPGSTVPIGDESFTLYAVWSPVGVEVIYNANVGAAVQCSQGGANVVGDARQSAPVVVQEGGDGGVAATQAPCAPVDAQLAGWALTGDGPSVVAPGAALPASFTSGSSYVLYAKWQVVYGLTFSTESLSMAPGQQATVTITATLNGAPAANATVMLSLASDELFALGVPQVGPVRIPVDPVVVTDANGQTTVTVASSTNLTASSPPTTLTAAYGNTTASVQLTPAVAVKRSIEIEGLRLTVSGKPGIRITGRVVGVADGDRVIPYIRFPGQTEFSAMTGRPEVVASAFAWQRKTGKKVDVYVTSEDGTVQSNRIIIPAK